MLKVLAVFPLYFLFFFNLNLIYEFTAVKLILMLPPMSKWLNQLFCTTEGMIYKKELNFFS